MEISPRTWLGAHRLTVLVGHFGSGKSEVALNLAMAFGKRGMPFSLADLDVVDPYFRSRECRQMIEENGGKLICSSQSCIDADVPSLPPEVMTLFDNKDRYGILDIGGDASGARVLARYRRYIREESARVLCVVNANRPLTDTAEKAETYIRSIERASGLRIDGIVNNTHLCSQTELQDIREGARMAEALSATTGIPVVCHAVSRALAADAARELDPVFPMEIYLKKPWEQALAEKEI